MPLLKTSNTDLVRVELSTPGEWVEVKRKLGKDDERRRSMLILAGQRVTAGQPLTEYDLGPLLQAVAFATMEVAIKQWSIVDAETGKPADLTAANLRALSDEDVALISAAFGEMYAPPRSDDETKNLSASGAPSSKTAGESPSNSGG